jgi:hypothetical protein
VLSSSLFMREPSICSDILKFVSVLQYGFEPGFIPGSFKIWTFWFWFYNIFSKFSYIFLTHFFIFSRIQLSAAGMKFKGALSRNLHTSETLSVQWPDWLPISLWSKQDWRSLSWNYTHHWERSPLKSPFTSTGQLIIFIKAILFGL